MRRRRGRSIVRREVRREKRNEEKEKEEEEETRLLPALVLPHWARPPFSSVGSAAALTVALPA